MAASRGSRIHRFGAMKSFLTACGLAEPLQLIVESQTEEGDLRLFHQPFALTGRDARADIVLNHPHVSRRHVYLQVVDGQVFWIDLESRTGTRLDGSCQKSGWLDGGRPISVGPYLIRPFIRDRAMTGQLPEQNRLSPLVAVASGELHPPDVALEFLNGPSQATMWPVRRTMSLIGSASGCKFRLTDTSVSRFHASLLRTSSGLWIVDLLGQGGVFVNDVVLRFSPLTDGDQLRIGRYLIRVVLHADHKGSHGGSPNRPFEKPNTQPSHHNRESFGPVAPTWTSVATRAGGATALTLGIQVPARVATSTTLSQVEVADGEIIPPFKLASPEMNESVLVPLVNQFGLMQQQMFDQFQQAMAMMVQMFGTMHRDQMATIREELDRLRELTDEFNALKTELANRSHAEVNRSSAAPEVVPVIRNRLTASKPDAPPRAVAPNESRHPSSIQGDELSANRASSSASAIDPPGRRRSGDSNDASPLEPSMSAARVPSNGNGKDLEASPRAKSSEPKSVASEKDSVVWLHQRIMALQQERETRWQKLLKLLPGLS